MSSAAVPPSAARTGVVPPLWRTDPARLARLVAGLVIFGAGDALIIRAAVGNSPWTVFAQGVSRQTPLTIGQATILVGAALLVAWIPLGVRLGLGTVLNVVVIGTAIDLTLLVLPAVEALPVRAGLLLAGIATIGMGSGLYLGTRHGPGPRDGLMTGLHLRTGRPVGLVRGGIELAALSTGWLMGGTVGLGTVVFALLIGPSVQAGLSIDRRLWRQPPAAQPPAVRRR